MIYKEDCVPNNLPIEIDHPTIEKIKLKLAEYALRESDEKYQLTFECASIGIAHLAPNGQWLEVNQRVCQMLGYSKEELLELTFQDVTYSEDLPADLLNLAHALKENLPGYSMEKRYIKKDGTIFWIHLSVSIIRYPSGRLKYFISVIEDINERKTYEEKLKALNESLAKEIEEKNKLIALITESGQVCCKYCPASQNRTSEDIPSRSN